MAGTLVVTDTFDGPEAIAFARCGVCGWEGWGTFDLNIVEVELGEYEHDEEPEQACPCCGVHELELDFDRDPRIDIELISK